MVERLRPRKLPAGFTLVELLIVIIVIAILAAISVVAYNGIQQRAQDTERAADFSSMHKAVELYYVKHGSYPYHENMVGNTAARAQWALANLDIAQGVLINPTAAAGTHTSWTAGGSSITSSAYSYYALNSAGGLCAAEGQCTGGYRMSWRNNAGEQISQNKNT